MRRPIVSSVRVCILCIIPSASAICQGANGYLAEIRVEFTPNQVGIHGLQRDLRRWGRKVGVYPLSVHRLRKTCATLRLARGAPTESVRKLLGHSTDRVLRHYAALSDKQQAELLEQTSPLSHIAKRKRR